MADSRIKDAAGEVLSEDIQTLLNNLYFAVDSSAFSDFKKILLKTFLTEAIVTNNTNNYQAMTPKAFYDSVMTAGTYGIGILSTNGDVTSKTGNGLLQAFHQTLMQAQWFKDWFISNGRPAMYVSSTEDLTDGGAIAFNAVWKGDLAQYQTVTLNPTMITGVELDTVSVYYVLSVTTPGYSERARLNYRYGTTERSQDLGGAAWLNITPDNRHLYIKAKRDLTNCRISINVNATVR